MRQLERIQRGDEVHWVGDGFPVCSLFTYREHAEELSPFLLLDHAGPADFPPAEERPGVDDHPHRGFETVTVVYAGEVSHRDSSGATGTVGPGDVQWMTAGAGVIHQEFHSEAFARTGGRLHMAQLWVNLPARDKMTAPRYQTLRRHDIPVVALPGGSSTLRVIAGAFQGNTGPAQTFTPVNVWDLSLAPGDRAELPVPEGHTTLLVVLQGRLGVNDGEDHVAANEVACFARTGGGLLVQATTETVALLLSGEPLDEPVVGHGPFVMNSLPEIRQAFVDLNAGRLGRGKEATEGGEG